MADQSAAPSSFSHEKLRDFLWHDNLDTRKRFLELATKNDLFIPRWNVPLAEQREIAFQRLQAISKAKLFSVKDFLTNPRNIFTGTSQISATQLASPKFVLFWPFCSRRCSSSLQQLVLHPKIHI